MSWGSYVALGDSFTEGLDDPDPAGPGYRGWADLVAQRLAGTVDSGFRYANLAVRGRLLDDVVREQLPLGLAMRPALFSFAAGGNDALRRRFDPSTMEHTFTRAIGSLRATGADVLVFRFADLVRRLPAKRMLAPRVALFNRVVGEVAEAHGAILIDLWRDDEFDNPLLWSEDRLHLSPAGHRRVAGHVLAALGVPADDDWLVPPGRPAPLPWVSARRADLRWVGRHLAPWMTRRITGRSSGDAVSAKRPELAPFDAG